ncbi:MAG TPA: hypothetical protein DCQ06_08045 [Myxococcales bacterium]|nr:hypothetical protein [Myxococcales bacterium]
MRWLLIATIVHAVACTPFPEQAEYMLFEPDATRGGLGKPGPYGVGCSEVLVPVRAWDSFEMTVCWPADSSGQLGAKGPFPAVLLVHGGLVNRSRYQWLSGHFASRGYLVAAPAHKAELALLEQGNVSAALDWLETASANDGVLSSALQAESTVLVGHSLGAVVAAMRWAQDDRFYALVMLAGFAASGTDLQTRAGSPSLTVGGQRDPLATPTDVREGFERLPIKQRLVMVTGMHHYAWTDGNSAADLASDDTPTRPVAALRDDALRLIDAFVDTHLLGATNAYKALAAGQFPGLEVSQ